MKIFLPHRHLCKLSDLDVDSLLADGYRGFMIDMDNTMVIHNSPYIPDENRKWVDQCKHSGTPIVLITYNCRGRFIEEIAQTLDCPLIKVRFPYLHHNTVVRAAKIMGIKPNEIIGVNDFRIALAALHLFGCTQTILVNPICRDSEKSSPVVKCLRWIENRIIVPTIKKT